jgi:DNA-binding response OmpR family regulator
MREPNWSILILEDDENLRETLVETLEDEGFSCAGAGSAAEAVIASDNQNFDLVISDVRMAGALDGLGALELLKLRKPELHCIVMTGFADLDAPTRALAIKVDDYIYKPFGVVDLVRQIRAIRGRKDNFFRLRTLAGKLSGVARALLPSAFKGGDDVLQRLSSARVAMFNSYRLAVRTRRLPRHEAYELWKAILVVEDAFEAVDAGRETVATARVEKGLEAYCFVDNLLKAGGKSTAIPWLKSAKETLESRQSFGLLFENVSNGLASIEDLLMAHFLQKNWPLVGAENSEFLEVRARLWDKHV